ncbi:hypothetical protein AAMO2058_001308400 [Amorphochlora amoebiformis]
MGTGLSSSSKGDPVDTMRRNDICPHVHTLSKTQFRKMVRRKFLGEVNGSIPKSASIPPEVKENSPAHVIANAAAPFTGKDDLLRTQTILHCEACAGVGEGKAKEAKEYVADLAKKSKIGAICNLELWLCMHCGKMACLDSTKGKKHVFDHYKETGHSVWIQCHDSHIFCIPCQKFLYPRELSGSSAYERALDDIVYQWLLTLGRVRVWWRVLDKNGTGGSEGDSKIVRGIENFGNTCFFTSTCQALTHCPTLVSKISSLYDPDRPIQTELTKLMNVYWDSKWKNNYINPRPFFRAVQRNALFGQYGDHTMEDANSLIVDILNGLEPKMVNETFGVGLCSLITCRQCQGSRDAGKDALKTFDKNFPEKPTSLITSYAVGPPPKHTALPMETVLSLAICSDSDMTPTNSETEVKENKKADGAEDRVIRKMTIHMKDAQRPSVKLEELIQRYFVEESIPDYRCPTCKTKGGCHKQVKPKRLPPVLLLQLKRFAPIAMGVQIKCHRKVDIPKTLTLDNPSGGKIRYTLSSMIVHDGGMGGGHNMCYTPVEKSYRASKTAKEDEKTGAEGDDGWIWFSDRHIGAVSHDEVKASEPYIVIFEQA